MQARHHRVPRARHPAFTYDSYRSRFRGAGGVAQWIQIRMPRYPWLDIRLYQGTTIRIGYIFSVDEIVCEILSCRIHLFFFCVSLGMNVLAEIKLKRWSKLWGVAWGTITMRNKIQTLKKFVKKKVLFSFTPPIGVLIMKDFVKN